MKNETEERTILLATLASDMRLACNGEEPGVILDAIGVLAGILVEETAEDIEATSAWLGRAVHEVAARVRARPRI